MTCHWNAVRDELVARASKWKYVVDAGEAWALRNQAGWDTGEQRRDGYEMVDSMKELGNLGRDNAIALVKEWSPADGAPVEDIVEVVKQALQKLKERAGRHGSRGVERVIRFLDEVVDELCKEESE